MPIHVLIKQYNPSISHNPTHKRTHTHALRTPKHKASHTYLGCSFNVCIVLEQQLHNTTMTVPRRYEQCIEITLHNHHVLGGRRLVCGRSAWKEEGDEQGSATCHTCVKSVLCDRQTKSMLCLLYTSPSPRD